jgi:hypothetical protein
MELGAQERAESPVPLLAVKVELADLRHPRRAGSEGLAAALEL